MSVKQSLQRKVYFRPSGAKNSWNWTWPNQNL